MYDSHPKLYSIIIINDDFIAFYHRRPYTNCRLLHLQITVLIHLPCHRHPCLPRPPRNRLTRLNLRPIHSKQRTQIFNTDTFYLSPGTDWHVQLYRICNPNSLHSA